MRKITVIHGPNLNLLGEREPEIYGSMTLDEINQILKEIAEEKNISISFFQSNHEGVIIDKLHEVRKSTDGIILNPAGLTHSSVSLRDAISAIQIPTVEVHLTDIFKREDFRKISIVKGACIASFMGEGSESYKKALNHLISVLN